MSASPAPSTDSASAGPRTQEQITFRFCRECSNMLYPKEDRITSKLMFACRTCQFSEETISSCVFRNNLYNTVGETAGVTQDVGSDPTVGDHYDDDEFSVFTCTLCGLELDYGEGCAGGEPSLVLGEKGSVAEGPKVATFDVSEMSRMEEDDEDADGEEEEEEEEEEVARDKCVLVEDSHAERVGDGGVPSHRAHPECKSF